METIEQQKDVTEQQKLKSSPRERFPTDRDSAPIFSATNSSATDSSTTNSVPFQSANEDIFENDEEYLQYIQRLKDQHDDESHDGNDQCAEVEDDVEEDEIDDPSMRPYFPDEFNVESITGNSSAQHVMGSYVRVVHTNGIHNIAMISCECQGHDTLPKDLLAARLLPASFDRIRTLFSAQLLDHFRLCNLELKSSAYHFYHLLQRLTNPMDPASVVDLYREFRRMSRIWRWMKRLKWAGFGNKHKEASDTRAGQLTIFCPACPQPGINLADNWKEDPARFVLDVNYVNIAF